MDERMRQSRSRVGTVELEDLRAGHRRVQASGIPADALCMGARLGFADVLFAKLTDAPPLVASGRLSESCIASPSWVHRLEPLRVASASVLHQRYPQPASAAPAAAGIPVEAAQEPARSGSRASAGLRPPVQRSPREEVAIQLLNRLGASLTAAATDDDVRAAYRRLVRASHPDRHHGADSATLDGHTRRLRAIIRAWDIFQGRAAAA
jgi:hypothetical protein